MAATIRKRPLALKHLYRLRPVFVPMSQPEINVINVRFTSCDEQTDISSKNFKNLYFHLIKNLNHRVFVPNTDLYMPHRIHIER